MEKNIATEATDAPEQVKCETMAIDAIDPAMNKRVLRKLDMRLVPLLCLCYMLQFLDKSSLSYAALLSIQKDLGLVGQQYSWASSIFYFGYLLMSYPTSYLIVKFPIGKYVSATVIIWSAIIMLHAACSDFGGIATVRLFLGIAEAAVAPSFSILIGTFYKREEQALRQCFWFVGNALAGVFGGLISYGVAHITTGFPPWKVLFLLFGGCTIVWGCVMLFFLPSAPATSTFLTEEEREVAVARLQTSTSVSVVYEYKLGQVREALLDPQTWLLVVYTFAINIPNGGLVSFGSLIISGFGFSTLRTLILQIPVACSQVFWILLGAAITTFLKRGRLATMILMVAFSVIGTAMMFAVAPVHKATRLAGFCLTVAYVANLPLSLALVTSNVAGYTKKTVVLAMVFVAYCIGNIAGPQFFKSSQAPGYRSGLIAGVCGFGVSLLCLILLMVYYIWQNNQRDAEGTIAAGEEEILVDDQTDQQHRGFRYMP
ncbi:hypothetical protein SEUCBS139899_009039 [Sporothrix eucalyptigena]|uniref:Major facilitator superfamily (MFS) profile domain-containing protein n=1 Tax=Sporothrix eucalyptigena TaxID=1812306 RepID=A0ABP0C4C1_9PEZI